MDSRIVRIDGYELACDLPEPIGNALRFFDRRGSLFVCVTTADGTQGWGETWSYPSAAAALIRDVFGPKLIGADAAMPLRLWHGMAGQLVNDRRGLSHMAISALDMAVWDASARLAGVSLATRLGGASRTRLPTYVSGPFLKPGADAYRDFRRDIDGYLAAGFRAIKMRLGRDRHRDLAVTREVRALVGDAFPLMADLNEGHSLAGALDLGRRLAECDLGWLEEPIRHTDIDGYSRLAAALPLPIAGGEALFGLEAFRDFLARRCFDVVQPDIALCGGITETLRIAALADAFEIAVAPHVWGGAINFYASLQVASVLPARRGVAIDFPVFEFDTSHNPLRDLFGVPPLGADGSIAVPDGPGLGINVDAARLEPFTTAHFSLP